MPPRTVIKPIVVTCAIILATWCSRVQAETTQPETAARVAAMVMTSAIGDRESILAFSEGVLRATRQSRCDAVINGIGNPIKNCGFEQGLDGWRHRDVAEPFAALAARESGTRADPLLGFFATEPSEGESALVTGFDGKGPATIILYQTVELPFWTTELRFDYRAAWDFALGEDATKDRHFEVSVRRPGGKTLLRRGLMTAQAGGFELDSGTQRGAIDLTRFAGEKVNISFRWIVPENKTGPGWFQLDNVRLRRPTELSCGSSLSRPTANPAGPHWYRLLIPRQVIPQVLELSAAHNWVGSTSSTEVPLLELYDLSGHPMSQGEGSINFAIEPAHRNPEGTGNEDRGAGDASILIALRADTSDAAGAVSRISLRTNCVSGRIQSYETSASLAAHNDDVGSAQWHRTTACPEAALEGHSGRGIARWGNPNSCTDYATAGATTDQLAEGFAIGVHSTANPCYRNELQLAFNYFLDFEDGPEFDRARVVLVGEDGTTQTVLDNGAEVGGLTSGTGRWQRVELPLATPSNSEGAQAPIREVRFVGETSDDLNNWGRGFLVDDVRVECRNGSIGSLTFEPLESEAEASEPAPNG